MQRYISGDCLARLALDQRTFLANDGFDQCFVASARDVERIDGLAAAQNGDTIADLTQFAKAMTDIENGDAVPDKVADDLEHALKLGLVERRRRLVHDDDLGVHGEGTGNGCQLLIGNGERFNPDVRREFGTDPLQRFARAPAAFLVIDEPELAGRMAKKQILFHRQLRNEIKLLIDHRDAEPCGFRRRAQLDRHAIQHQYAIGRAKCSGDDLEQGRLARAIGSEEAVDLPRTHIQ